MTNVKDSPQKRARVKAGLSQVAVAARAGTAINTVSRYELEPRAVHEPQRVRLDAVYEPLMNGTND